MSIRQVSLRRIAVWPAAAAAAATAAVDAAAIRQIAKIYE